MTAGGFSAYLKAFRAGMMQPALAVYILSLLRGFRKPNMSSCLLAGVLFASYLFWSLGVRADLSSYQLVWCFPFVLLCGVWAEKPDSKNMDWVEQLGGNGPRVAAYLRVSTSKQVKGQSLEVQRELINKMKEIHRSSIIYGFIDPGKSGKDFDKRKTKVISELAEKRLIDELWITQVDRLGRECKKLLLLCLNLCEERVTIRTPEREYNLNDILGVLTLAFEAYRAEAENISRVKRVMASKARLFKLKKWNKPVSLGYGRLDSWIEKLPEWEQLVIDAFAKLLERKSLESVRKFINAKYCSFLARPLTRSQIRRLLSDPVYAGQPRYLGEVVTDRSLAFISMETFIESQKILEKILSKHKPKVDDPVKDLVEKYGISALDFLDEIDLVHKCCGGLVRKNGTRTYRYITRRIFECKKCQRQWIVPSNSQLKKIQTQITGQDVTSRKSGPNHQLRKGDCTNPLTPTLDRATRKCTKTQKRSRKKRNKSGKGPGDEFTQSRLDDSRF